MLNGYRGNVKIEETAGKDLVFPVIFVGLGGRKMEKRIIEGALDVIGKQGVKFTMDDVATELGMSKKTIYTVFRDKNQLMLAMVDYVFDHIKEGEAEVVSDPSLALVDKIRRILGVMPEVYHGWDFTHFYTLQDKYPQVYDRIRERLENGWELTLKLIDDGVKQGIVRPVNPVIFQMVYEAATERFIMGSELDENHIPYMEALNELVMILVDGIVIGQA